MRVSLLIGILFIGVLVEYPSSGTARVGSESTKVTKSGSTRGVGGHLDATCVGSVGVMS